MTMRELRKTIDRLDAHLVRLLNERTRVVLEIGRLKKKKGDSIYVPAREKEVLARVNAVNRGPLPAAAIRAIYREIMSASLALEKSLKVAYLGPPATFSHQAARERFGASVEYESCETISDVFNAVEKHLADYGVVPVENSTEGAVTYTLDCFADTTLKICAEIYLPISQCLLANVPKARIKRLYSFPQVLGQCRQWLQREMAGIDILPAASTAKAAELAASMPDSGALASHMAAEVYGLNVLASDIQDLSENKTRFVVLGHSAGPPSGADKTSLIFTVRHRAGSLFDAIEAFKKYGLNMTRIESRPSKNKAWEYFFFVDIEGHTADKRVAQALEELAAHCTLLKILGSYPCMREERDTVRPKRL
jgi:chorismate mutase/prephenate dehydratase